MASRAQARGLPPELPVMASLVESGMKNLSGGDRDSVGLFQMRVGIWNKGDYAGYPSRPDRQLDWFLDQAEAVKRSRLAKGLPVDKPSSYGDWVADIERPAAAYRGRYQERLDDARALLEKAGHGHGHHGSEHAHHGAGDGAVDVVDAAGHAHAGPRAVAAVAEAKKYLGTPYKWGGSSPKTGFDCSGLVQWAYAKAGIHLPRVSEQQILAPGGTPVDRKHLLPGDLVFFRDPSGDVHHVGISLGGDKFIDSPHTGADVREASLSEPYYAQQFTGGRRFDHMAPQADAHAAAVDPHAVRHAQAAAQRDAEEVARPGTDLHRALDAQERRWQRSHVQVLPALDRSQVRSRRR
jgi:cell wall-associated NlpC family hydrolase